MVRGQPTRGGTEQIYYQEFNISTTSTSKLMANASFFLN